MKISTTAEDTCIRLESWYGYDAMLGAYRCCEVWGIAESLGIPVLTAVPIITTLSPPTAATASFGSIPARFTVKLSPLRLFHNWSSGIPFYLFIHH